MHVPISAMNIEMLKLRGRWQQDVGVIGSVGLEMFQHYGEQIFARKTGANFVAVGGHRDGVAVIDNQRFNRVLRGEQGITNRAHVHAARLRAPNKSWREASIFGIQPLVDNTAPPLSSRQCQPAQAKP